MKKRRIIQDILWTERPTGAVMGDWFTLTVEDMRKVPETE